MGKLTGGSGLKVCSCCNHQHPKRETAVILLALLVKIHALYLYIQDNMLL